MRVVLGLGLREHADLAGFYDLTARLSAPQDCAIAVPEFRRHLPLIAVLRGLGRQLTLIPRTTLSGVPTMSQSARSLAAYGTGSVAEACALIACPGGVILQPARRSFDNRLTGALAQAPFDAPIINERPHP
ncbi:cobalamin biosynthesis protein [Falsigemmobacter faecalis]|uniref:Precorrin methylase n=1 Tax=Falsigemmobacter faecalis TaxID=2488730 RepID=A0A3P3DCN6_9RHOB|nr:cobalamin biosynthesis protein [Falsigemmobacter faecalis]RRH72060.1 precorrin methylase [Falsigemmobacter faecalis]